MGIALGIGTAVAEGVGNQIFGKLNQERELAGQKRALEQANNAQFDLWNRTGYGAQKAQMEAAGLNPGLMYGMGGGGGQTAGSGSATARGDAGGLNLGMGLQMGMQNELLKAQKENIEANTAKVNAETTKIGGVDTKLAEATANNVIEGSNLIKAQTQSEALKQGLIAVETDVKRIEQSILNGTADEQIQQAKELTAQMGANVRMLRNQADIQEATKDTQIKQYSAFLSKTYAEIALARMGVKQGEQGMAESKARIENMTNMYLNAQWETQIKGWAQDTNEKMQKLMEAWHDLPDRERAALESLYNMDPLERWWKQDWKQPSGGKGKGPSKSGPLPSGRGRSGGHPAGGGR